MQFRGAFENDNEQTGGRRIERAAVANFFETEMPANVIHDIVRGEARRFVYEEDAVKRSELWKHVRYRQFEVQW